jgi:hypothetical protein
MESTKSVDNMQHNCLCQKSKLLTFYDHVTRVAHAIPFALLQRCRCSLCAHFACIIALLSSLSDFSDQITAVRYAGLGLEQLFGCMPGTSRQDVTLRLAEAAAQYEAERTAVADAGRLTPLFPMQLATACILICICTFRNLSSYCRT